MNRCLIVLSAMAILTIMMGSVATAELYGTIGAGSGANSTLVELDPDTGGVIRTVGAVGYTVNGLTYDPVSKKLYGGTSYHDSYNGLIEINLSTGVGTPAGAPGWGAGGVAVTNVTANSAGALFGWSEWHDSLFSIDKATGIGSLVGWSGVGTWANGLAFDSSGQLFMINGDAAVYGVDTSTGAATFVGNIGGFPGGYGGYLHHGDFDLATDLYYGISDSGSSNPRAIYVVDVSSLSIVDTLPTIDNLHTLAFVPEAVVPVPAAVYLAVIGIGFSGRELRRRRML